MALRDEVPKATTTHTPSRTGSASNTTYGTGPETYDGDVATLYGIQTFLSTEGTATTTVTDQHTWSATRHIKRIYSLMYGRAHPNDLNPQRTITFTIEVLQGSTWTNVYSKTYTSNAVGNYEVTETVDITNSGSGWTNVIGARSYVYAKAYSFGQGSQQYAASKIYETQAYYTIKKSYAGYV